MKRRISCMVGILFCLILCSGVSKAQCPGEDEVKVLASNRQSFEGGQGTLTFSFSQALFSDASRKLYRIRLYEKASQRYIYDDNNPPSLNTVKISILHSREIKFEGLPNGDYALELHGKECQYQRFNVSPQPSSINN